LARGIELDWVVIRINTVGKVVALCLTAVLAAGLLVLVHYRMNPSPDVAARRAIRQAERARDRAQSASLPESWKTELEQAEAQLEEAKTAYAHETFTKAVELATAARSRFAALAGGGGTATVGEGRFHSIDGRVSIQHAGKSEWETAKPRAPVFNGDFVKTGRHGSAEILFADGTLFHVAPNSLLEIHHGTRTSHQTGSVKMIVGKVKVSTGRSSSIVSTDTVQTQIDGDSRVAVDVDQDQKKTIVSAYSGRAILRNQSGEQIRLATRQQVVASEEGRFEEPRRIPSPPRPLAPVNNAAFDIRDNPVIELKWAPVSGARGFHLQVGRSKTFSSTGLDVDAPLISGDHARLQAIHPGTYFWRLASVHEDGVVSEWSTTQRFRIYSPEHRQVIRDVDPPELEIAPIRQLGHTFIIEGKTEVGATVTINGATVETDSRGRFRKAVEVHQLGWNEIVIGSTDPAGNESVRRERVYLEEY